MLENGIAIEHACEMSCACTTCHVIIREGFASLEASEELEDDLLDKAWGLEPNSRLSCQALVNDTPLVVEIPRYSINMTKEAPMKWTDINDLAVELSEAHPVVDPMKINFVDLMNWIVALPGFDDDKHCGEKSWRRSSRLGSMKGNEIRRIRRLAAQRARWAARRLLTGFFRDGCCNTSEEDVGSHTVCVVLTAEFLEFSRASGNDLSTPRPEFDFSRLKPGGRWCQCTARRRESLTMNCAPRVVLNSTNEAALEIVELDDLKRHAIDLN